MGKTKKPQNERPQIKKIAITGCFDNYKKHDGFTNLLHKLYEGFDKLIENEDDDEIEITGGWGGSAYAMSNSRLKDINKADGLYVINYDGYVNDEVIYEIAYSAAKNKPIFFFEKPTMLIDTKLATLYDGKNYKVEDILYMVKGDSKTVSNKVDDNNLLK